MTIYRKKSTPTYKQETFAIKIFDTENGLVARVLAEKYYRHFMKENARVGQEGTITITLKKPKRSVLQNNFYWVYLDLIALGLPGNDPEDIHNWAKGKFLTTGITEVFGSKVRKVKSTTQLNRSEFAEYLLRIEEDTGVPIPDPDEFNIGLTIEEFKKARAKQKAKYSKIKGKIK